MPLKKFDTEDILKNVIKTTPQFEIKIYMGKAYINNSLQTSEIIYSFNTSSS